MPKLRRHILPRIKEVLRKEAVMDNGISLGNDGRDNPLLSDPEDLRQSESISAHGVLFKNDCMYSHKIMRINYTTYNIRRSQDVVHPGTAHCNIMVLSSEDSEEQNDNSGVTPDFLYGEVLGIYHVNVIYRGPGMQDYRPRRIEFLWVRWYEPVESAPLTWNKFKLERLRFPSITEEGALSFIDPSDVVRTCHIVPRLAGEKSREWEGAMSLIAKNKRDYCMYYVNR
jgi:hypothetical protein